MGVLKKRLELTAAIMTVGLLSAACGSAETAKASAKVGRDKATTSSRAHEMAHDSTSDDSTAHDTGGAHDGGHGGGTDTTGGGSHDGGHGGGTDTTGGGQGHNGGHGGGTTTTGGHNGGHGGGTTTTTDPCATGATTTTGHGSHGGSGGGVCGPGPVQYDDLDPVTKAGVDAGLAVALKYPTSADAEAAGWSQATVYFPGIAQHNLKSGWLDSIFDPSEPEVLLYGSDGKLVGFNYIVYNGATPPAGFPGTDDLWHEHPALCRSYSTGLVIGGETLTDAECAAIGGYMFSFAGFYLLHVWAIPGYESPDGIFSHENTLLT